MLLKTFWIALLFAAAGGMMTARAQTDGVDAAIGAEENALGQLKPNASDAMGPWPLNRNYLNAVDPLNQLNVGEPLNQNYLTSTGQRVPRPSVSQGAPTTQPERKIKDKTKALDLNDERWERSICSNC